MSKKTIHIISDDFELINALKEIEMNVKTISCEQMNEVPKDDILVVSDKKIEINKLISLKEKNINCFYLSSLDYIKQIEKTDKSLLEIKNIKIVPPKRTVIQIRDIIISNIYKKEKVNNIITFFGTDSKVGTTSIAQNLALYLSNNLKDKYIMYLCLNGQDGLDYSINAQKIKESSISNIKSNLKINILTLATVFDYCCKINDNLYLLRGESDIKETVYYNQNEINRLIELCKENFHFVIIDAGNINNLHLRMTYSALINSDNKILITDQTPKSNDLFIKAKLNILEPLEIKDFKCVVNKYIKDNIMQKKDKLIEQYKLPIISTIPYIDDYYHIANEQNIEQFMKDKYYKKSIQELAEYITKKQGIKINDNTHKKTFFNFKTKLVDKKNE